MNDYGRVLLENWPCADLRILAYITKYPENVEYEEPGDLTFKLLKWSELYKRFAMVKQERPGEVGSLELELLELMEDWNMNGHINAAHLRSFVSCFDNRVGEMLMNAQNDAWHASQIDDVLENLGMRGNWTYDYSKGEQTSATIEPYGVRIWMGFRCDRRDEEWNVDNLEIPSPTVKLKVYEQIDQEFPQLQNWTEDVEGMPDVLRIRQPAQNDLPNYGTPLYEYYMGFFKTVFCEIREAIENN